MATKTKEPTESVAEPIEHKETGIALRVDAERMLTLALDKGASIEALEKLLAMRTQLNAEAAAKAFMNAMSGFQADCPVIGKSKTAKGSKFSYNYTPMETIKPTIQSHLVKHGLSYRMEYAFEDNAVSASCIVSHRDGHSERTMVRIPIDKAASMNDSQKVGAACSYAGRYALVGALGLVCGDEDDDGQSLAPAANGAPLFQRQPETPADSPVDRNALLAQVAKLVAGREEFAVRFLIQKEVLKPGQSIADVPTYLLKRMTNGGKENFLRGIDEIASFSDDREAVAS